MINTNNSCTFYTITWHEILKQGYEPISFPRCFHITPENVFLLPKKLVLFPIFNRNAGVERRNI